jgi:hypothetical protein
MIVIGLDLSLRSPGIAVSKPDGSVHCYFYPNRRREQGFSFCTGLFSVQALPCFLSDIRNHIHRSTIIATDILNIISGHFEGGEVRVNIEGYAFGLAHSAGASRLYELGGIVRQMLFTHDFPYVEIPPSRVKKLFCGRGNADKRDMYLEFRDRGFPNLIQTMKFKKITNNNNVPCPVQDIVDSVALALIW